MATCFGSGCGARNENVVPSGEERRQMECWDIFSPESQCAFNRNEVDRSGAERLSTPSFRKDCGDA